MAGKGLPEFSTVVLKRTQVAIGDGKKSNTIWVCWKEKRLRHLLQSA